MNFFTFCDVEAFIIRSEYQALAYIAVRIYIMRYLQLIQGHKS